MTHNTFPVKRKFFVRGLASDRFIGAIELDYEPDLDVEIVVNGTVWVVKDKNIGQRLYDELYVQTADGKEPTPGIHHNTTTGEVWSD